MNSEPLLSTSLFITVVSLVSLVGYHKLWKSFTRVSLLAPKLKPEQASRGRVWCFFWAAFFLLSSSSWLVIKILGVQTKGEEPYKDYLYSVLNPGKSMLGVLANEALILKTLYLAIVPYCLESALANGAASPKTVSLLYYLMPLSNLWVTAHQLGLYALGGGSAINPLWVEEGVIEGTSTSSPEFDVAYWFANLFYAAVVGMVSFVSARGGSMVGSLLVSTKSKDQASVLQKCKETNFFHMNILVLFFSVWYVLATSGIPDPVKGGYFLEPFIEGSKKIYSKQIAQVMIIYVYSCLCSHLYPALRDKGVWWAKLASLHNGLTFYSFFLLAFIIVMKKGGHRLHPSWTALDNAPTHTGKVIDLLFFFSTVNFTVVNTNIQVFGIVGHLPKIVYKPFETVAKNIRTSLAFNGMLQIVISGMWTYTVCSGLTVPIKFLGLDEKLSHPPIHNCNVRYVVEVHKQHLFNGILTTAMGAMVYNMEEYLKKNFSAGVNLKTFSGMWIKVFWIYHFASIAAIHCQVIPPAHSPLSETSDMSVYSLVCQIAFASLAVLRCLGGAYFFYYVYKASKYFSKKYTKVE